MNKFSFKKTFVYFGIFLIIFLADRISKLYILSVLENSGEVDIYINSYILIHNNISMEVIARKQTHHYYF